MECYLDNSATTAPSAAAIAAANTAMNSVFGNPSSLHRHGFEALKMLEQAREGIAKSLSADSRELYFTPSGTVANNTAIFGAVQQNRRRGNKIVTTAIEHPSVSQCMHRLEEQGFEVVRLLPDSDGHIPLERFQAAIDAQTILVSAMAVNNEVGSILPFDRLQTVIRQKKSPALLHVDAVQGYMKLPIVPKKCGIDLLSVSAHKVHGLKGIGALYIRKGVKLKAYVLGGGQEEGVCSGTQGMPAIAAFATAVGELSDIRTRLRQVSALRDMLSEKLRALPDVHLNSPEDALPYILNLSLKGIPSQVSVNALSERGVYVSAGSACAKGHRSGVLTAMALPPERIDTAIRLSLSSYTTEDEIIYCADVISDVAAQLRKKG